MYRLKNAHRGERALIVMGGPSILATRMDLSKLAGKGFVTFLESKALTREFLGLGLRPDYYLMFFPEKSKGHSFHNVVHQSLVSNFDIEPLVREARIGEVRHLKEHVEDYFLPGKQNITHKRLLWRPDVFLPDSPLDLLPLIPEASVVTIKSGLDAMLRQKKIEQATYLMEIDSSSEHFSHTEYYAPQAKDGLLMIHGSRNANSAAIALYPLLVHMGFRTVYFIGSDFSMLGSLEHSAPYTFKSMRHFRIFFNRARRAFGTHFPSSDRCDAIDDMLFRVRDSGIRSLTDPAMYDSLKTAITGKSPFLRPRAEMRVARELMSHAPGLEFINVFSGYEFSVPAEGIRNIDFAALASS